MAGICENAKELIKSFWRRRQKLSYLPHGIKEEEESKEE